MSFFLAFLLQILFLFALSGVSKNFLSKIRVFGSFTSRFYLFCISMCLTRIVVLSGVFKNLLFERSSLFSWPLSMISLSWADLFWWSFFLGGANYCVCKDGFADTLLQHNIDYACGNGADCTGILQNGPCYNPNTIKDHCSYAVNSYYQRKASTGATCDFSGTASLTSTPPACKFLNQLTFLLFLFPLS